MNGIHPSNSFELLPDNIISSEIFRRVEVPDLICFTLVCKKWNDSVKQTIRDCKNVALKIEQFKSLIFINLRQNTYNLLSTFENQEKYYLQSKCIYLGKQWFSVDLLKQTKKKVPEELDWEPLSKELNIELWDCLSENGHDKKINRIKPFAQKIKDHLEQLNAKIEVALLNGATMRQILYQGKI